MGGPQGSDVMIDELEWTCPDCGLQQKDMIYSIKGSTLRCKKCLGTYGFYFKGPYLFKMLAGVRKESIQKNKERVK